MDGTLRSFVKQTGGHLVGRTLLIWRLLENLLGRKYMAASKS